MSRISRTLLPIILILCVQVILLSSFFGSEDVSHSGVVMQVAGSEIQITLPDEQLKVSSQELLEWVKSAAGTVDHTTAVFPSLSLPFASELAAGTK